MNRKFHRNLRRGKAKLIKAERAISAAAYRLKDRMGDTQENVMSYVKHNPLKTLGFSILAGVLLSQLRRLRK